jgi:hypothetical protein
MSIAHARGDEGSTEDDSSLITKNQGVQAIRKLAERFRGGVIITTNWDTFLDRALWNSENLSPAGRSKWTPSGSRIDYTPFAQEIVNFQGDRINAELADLPSTPLLKLHGSMNWLACPRCKRLIINPVIDLVRSGGGGKHWIDQTCWCEAEAEALFVTPSYAKSYSNLHLQAIWYQAQRALAEASRWVFVGFSIPSDDAWIRALLTRALAWKRATDPRHGDLEVIVVSYSEAPREAEQAACGRRASSRRTEAFVKTIGRYRSVLPGFAEEGRLIPWAGGLEAWVQAEMPMSITKLKS